ncbi:MAG: hypothetical protein AB7K68_16630 [Bacteriovoracia bacterium]
MEIGLSQPALALDKSATRAPSSLSLATALNQVEAGKYIHISLSQPGASEFAGRDNIAYPTYVQLSTSRFPKGTLIKDAKDNILLVVESLCEPNSVQLSEGSFYCFTKQSK